MSAARSVPIHPPPHLRRSVPTPSKMHALQVARFAVDAVRAANATLVDLDDPSRVRCVHRPAVPGQSQKSAGATDQNRVWGLVSPVIRTRKRHVAGNYQHPRRVPLGQCRRRCCRH